MISRIDKKDDNITKRIQLTTSVQIKTTTPLSVSLVYNSMELVSPCSSSGALTIIKLWNERGSRFIKSVSYTSCDLSERDSKARVVSNWVVWFFRTRARITHRWKHSALYRPRRQRLQSMVNRPPNISVPGKAVLRWYYLGCKHISQRRRGGNFVPTVRKKW